MKTKGIIYYLNNKEDYIVRVNKKTGLRNIVILKMKS